MSLPISIKQHQLESVKDSLSSALADIKSGEVKPVKALVILVEESKENGTSAIYYRSNYSLIDYLGILELAKTDLITLQRDE